MSPRRPRAGRPVLDALDDAERAVVLRALLDAHPELLDEAAALASEHLDRASRHEVAEALSWTLGTMPLEAMGARAGRQPGLGYVEPNEAAWELIEEAVEPYVADLHRLAGLGLTSAATEVALGVLAGLYRCRDAEEGTVLAWAPAADVTWELARWTVTEATKARVELPDDEVEDACPDWSLPDAAL